jgi:hypothetical protein
MWQCSDRSALNTRLRGAAITRDRTISRSRAHAVRSLFAFSFVFGIFHLRSVQRDYIRFHAV